MKKLRFLLALLLGIMAPQAWAADGDTFEATTVEGVTMTFKVISEAAKTCQAGTGEMIAKCIASDTKGKVTIPATAGGYTVTTVGAYAFFRCDAVTEIVVSEGITTLAGEYPLGYNNVVSITLPSTLTSLGDEGTFSWCKSLTSVNIPQGITEIPGYAFSGCQALPSIELPDGVTSIGEYGFSNCDALTAIELPAGVTSIGTAAFYLSENLTRVVVNNPTPVSIDEKCFSAPFSATLVVPKGAVEAYKAAANWSNFGTITDDATDPVDVGTFTAETVEGVTMTFKILRETDKTCQVGNGRNSSIATTYTGTVTIPAKANGYTVTTIGSGAFYNAQATKVVLPRGITTLDDYAFSYCKAITSIEFPVSVTSIGANAFTGIYDLKKVILHSLTGISAGANCFTAPSLATLYVPAGTSSYYSNAEVWKDFGTITELPDILTATTPEGVKVTFTIVDEMMKQCQVGGVYDIYGPAIDATYSGPLTLPEEVDGYTVTAIAEKSFWQCGITSVVIPEGVENIGSQAFFDCEALEEVTLPSTLMNADTDAFQAASALRVVRSYMSSPMFEATPIFSTARANNGTLYVPLSYLQNYKDDPSWSSAFKKIYPIEAIVYTTVEGVVVMMMPLDESAKTCQVGIAGYEDGKAIDATYTGSVTIPETANGYTVVRIADDAFNQCSMTAVDLPSTITYIGNNAFTNSGLTTLTVRMTTPPDIDPLAFTFSSSLTLRVPYESLGDYDAHATWSFFSTMIPFTDDPSLIIVEGESYDYIVYRISSEEDKTCSLETFMRSSLRAAYSGAVAIPASVNGYAVTGIGDYAFENTPSLSSVELPEGLTTIGVAAFQGCEALTSIILPAGLESIGNLSFDGCSNLVSVTAQMAVPVAIEASVFSNCHNAILLVPTGTKSVYEAADYWKEFKLIYDGATATTDEGVTLLWQVLDEEAKTCEISSGAGKSSFVAAIPKSYSGYITVPSTIDGYTVTQIGDAAFHDCAGLKAVGLPPTITRIGNFAFARSGINLIALPEGVESIDADAFASSSLVAATLPTTLKYIGVSAFSGCYDLQAVSILGSNVRIDQKAFSVTTLGTPSLLNVLVNKDTPQEVSDLFLNRKEVVLYVPRGSKAAYESSKTWGRYGVVYETDMSTGSGRPGDLNGDGKVTVADVTRLVNIITSK